jgi:hypothetical protein
MQRYANDRAIQRKAKLGKILTYGGLGIVIVILILSFSQEQLTNTLLIVTLIGMILSQYGIFLDNRWGKHPRIDEAFDQALKGLDSRHAIFHYELGANHVLIAPSGIFALVPFVLDGEINFDGQNWYQTRMRRGKERKRAIRNLTTDASVEIRSLNKSLQKRFVDQEYPEGNPILVFLHNKAIVNAEHAPIPAVHLKKLKGLIRKLDKGPTLDQGKIQQLADALGF